MFSRCRALAVAAPIAAALAFTASAGAAPVNGPAGEAFYTPPTNVPAAGTPGELLRYRLKSVKLSPGAPAVVAWDVMYRSSDSKGASNFVTGTVLLPKVNIPRYTFRNIVSYAPGTQGLAPGCAPSKQLVAGTEYESPNLVAALKRGYGVLVTDYAGYTTGGKPTYLAGRSQGNAVLDIAKAVKALPGSQMQGANPVAVWGYSQGGQSAGFAGEWASSYAPDVNLVGVAAGGVPGDFKRSARELDKSAGAAFLLGAVLGLRNQYPESIPFAELINATGLAAEADANRLCTFALFNKYGNTDINTFTNGDVDIEDLMAIPSVSAVLDAQKLGTRKIDAPVYQYHGQADQILPLDQGFQTKRDWCAKGSRVSFELYPAEHLTTQFQGATGALNWIADRFANKAAPTTCAVTTAPPSTADPAGGDHIVNLDKWTLSGTASLAKLRQSLTLPAGSEFTGAANLTQQRLVGGLRVPSFFTTIDILGLKVRTAINLVPTGDIQGTIKLDDNGNITIVGNAPVIVRVESLQLGLINLGTNCRTERGVQIPLSFSGPVSALGTGGLTFDSTATFPNFTDCGAYAPIISGLISGGGNRFVLTQTPPAPKSS